MANISQTVINSFWISQIALTLLMNWCRKSYC